MFSDRRLTRLEIFFIMITIEIRSGHLQYLFSEIILSTIKVRELVDKATNIVMNYTETESKVREATNDDPWGPSGIATSLLVPSTSTIFTADTGVCYAVQ
jgi:ENTH domain